jgi:hypothetical protein
MEERKSVIPHALVCVQVLLRFAFRLALLSVCAAYSSEGFAPASPVLLALSAFCAFVGIIRREAIFGSALTHWDEAAAYAFIARLVYALSGNKVVADIRAVYKTFIKSICVAYKLCLRLTSNSYGAMRILSTVPAPLICARRYAFDLSHRMWVIRYVR